MTGETIDALRRACSLLRGTGREADALGRAHVRLHLPTISVIVVVSIRQQAGGTVAVELDRRRVVIVIEVRIHMRRRNDAAERRHRLPRLGGEHGGLGTGILAHLCVAGRHQAEFLVVEIERMFDVAARLRASLFAGQAAEPRLQRKHRMRRIASDISERAFALVVFLDQARLRRLPGMPDRQNGAGFVFLVFLRLLRDDQIGGESEQAESGRGADRSYDGGERAFRICADEQTGKFQDHVAEHAAERLSEGGVG